MRRNRPRLSDTNTLRIEGQVKGLEEFDVTWIVTWITIKSLSQNLRIMFGIEVASTMREWRYEQMQKQEQ